MASSFTITYAPLSKSLPRHKLSLPITKSNNKILSFPSLLPHICISIAPKAALTPTPSTNSTPTITTGNKYWIVLVERPPQEVSSKPESINYYVNLLKTVLGSEKDAQMCVYDASCDYPFGFCCDIGEEDAHQLARMPGVLSVKPDPDYYSMEKDYSSSAKSISLLNEQNGSMLLFPSGSTRHWLVRIHKPGVGVVTKAQMVDYYVQILTKVMGNEKDAQMCIYHVSWLSDFRFCCEIDEECAKELAGVPGVLSVQPDENFGSENKDYAGVNVKSSLDGPNSVETSETPVKTKKLFITGLSFYTSEKTLRAAFEGFGELVEVKIIMDKISKRSKGYAFIEYTTEEAASAALKGMNGKIINGWMIVVDAAKSNPPKYSRGRPRPAF